MVRRTFIWFARYLLQLPIKITMLALADGGLLTGYVLGKTAVKDAFYSKFKFNTVKDAFYLKFKFNISFRFRSLLEWEWLIRWQQSVVSMVLWHRISRRYWVENLQLSLFVYIKSAHEFKWYTKTLWSNGKKNASIMNSRSSQTFNLVYTDIS